ncbi:putative transcriptional regulator [Arboricoccus pini]|uniref:UPF0301 protein SAMN07250955_101360 n=1 Tax=Arboricoccus pini TaxID=1963835 RepID=A0A212Q2N2_9PROT|nr:YqgE/AlgH family protein [Arboricoccus pini]SNB53418.1 putative transcriptional regulator [Arboricoccus pini]
MDSSSLNPDELAGRLLLATPAIGDPRFSHSVIFLCAHSDQGAMGLVVNQLSEGVRFKSIMEQFDLPANREPEREVPVHVGGPVEGSRGFVLHTPDFVRESTLIIDDHYALTATVDILKAIALNEGPRRCVFALGYTGWAPGQLDAEIRDNGWLVAPADVELVYGGEHEQKWSRAMGRLGIDPGLFSSVAGHA